MKEYSCDYHNIYMKIYIINLRGSLKNLQVQLLRSNALFLCWHEDTSLLQLFSDEKSGRQIIRNFSFRQRLHLLLSMIFRHERSSTSVNFLVVLVEDGVDIVVWWEVFLD